MKLQRIRAHPHTLINITLTCEIVKCQFPPAIMKDKVVLWHVNLSNCAVQLSIK